MTDHRIAYVVPTKDRPDDLRVLLASLVRQTVNPRQVVIVDGSDPDVRHVCDAFPGLPITYVRCFPPSLAKQRNAGMAALAGDITVAGYLDDDLELDPDATERMLAFWQNASPETGGAALAIRNQPAIQNSFLLRFFGMIGPVPGRMLRSGFPVPIPYLTETTETDWLYGGATLWRRSVIEKHSYDEWFVGHGFLEDVDYSYRVRQVSRLFIVGDSRCMHYSRPLSDSRQFDFARQQIYNRIYFVRKMGGFSVPRVCWALFGVIFLNTLSLIKHCDRLRFDRLRGNFAGLRMFLTGKTDPIAGYWK
jgi:GT2 family glycosyltransferase